MLSCRWSVKAMPGHGWLDSARTGQLIRAVQGQAWLSRSGASSAPSSAVRSALGINVPRRFATAAQEWARTEQLQGGLTYDAVGATRVQDRDWSGGPDGFRSFERTVQIGHGEQTWRAACEAVMSWAVKTRSGSRVDVPAGQDLRVADGQDRALVARLALLSLREPVRVVSVVEEDDWCGFAYGTLPGHPVLGEEAFPGGSGEATARCP